MTKIQLLPSLLSYYYFIYNTYLHAWYFTDKRQYRPSIPDILQCNLISTNHTVSKATVIMGISLRRKKKSVKTEKSKKGLLGNV